MEQSQQTVRTACTIIARNYLPQARVLAESLSASHPGSRLNVLILDDLAEAIGPGEPFTVLRPADILSRAEFNRMATMYTVVELATAVKPSLLRHLLESGAPSVAYFDPDIRIFTPLHDVFDAAAEHGVALTPHALTVLPRGGTVTQPEDLILDVGVFNLGFIAVGAGTPMVDWWADRLARECIIAPERGRFVDQRWIDLAMGYFAPAVLRDPGMNVAWWNLATRRVTASGDDYLVDDVPLRFFHFSGYDPRMPWLISRHQGPLPRALMAGQPALRRITGEYAQDLDAAGFEDWSTIPYGLATTPGGTELDALTRSLYRAGVLGAERGEGPLPPDPFSDGDATFGAWLAEPDPEGGGPSPAPRYGHALWLTRPDLRNRFADIHGDGAADFAGWMREADEIPLPIAQAVRLPAPPPDPPTTLTPGIRVVGLLHADRTDAEVGRRVLAAAHRAGIPAAATAITRLAGPGMNDVDAGDDGAQSLNVIAMPVGRISEASHYLGAAGRAGRRTAAIVSMDEWAAPIHAEDIAVVDEFWALSSTGAALLRAQPGCPSVYVMPPAPSSVPRTAAQAARPATILTVLDCAEPATRPELQVTLESFNRAFGSSEAAHLSILVLHADHDGQLMEELAFRTDGVPNVSFATAEPAEVSTRLAHVDVVLWLPAHADAALLVLDALASGIAVVASDVGQVADLPDADSLYRVATNGAIDTNGVAHALAAALRSQCGGVHASDDIAVFLAERIAAAGSRSARGARTRRLRRPHRAA